MDVSMKLNNFSNKAVDRVNDYFETLKVRQQKSHNNKVDIGNILNGQMPYPGVQTAAANWDE